MAIATTSLRETLARTGSGTLVISGTAHRVGDLALTGSGSLELTGYADPIYVSRALVTIVLGEGAGYVRAFLPGEYVPASVVKARNLHHLVVTALIER